ncbi:uncharacterized protein RJT20DRAFT_21698 [Scheffersomyces xylosifermentans]|uniref:uncharacterized protein n=1 Tax=Scheffersomyces xylosifermentans TaxID=1304137 RepID=UPI00315CFF0E
MGSCASKPKEKGYVPLGNITGRSKLDTTTQRLGTKNETAEVKQNTSTTKTTKNAHSEKPQSNGNVLGGSEGENTTDDKRNLSSREAAKRAAEERYQKNQEKLKESKDKLKTMSQLSKSEKGLV